MAAMIKLCELCGAEADVHCAADSAFFCRSCDDKIHGANSLVARHIRRLICPTCGSVSDNRISGLRFLHNLLFCTSCSSLSSSSSVPDCDRSTSTTAGDKTSIPIRKQRKNKNKRPNREAEGIFVNWCEKLGLSGSGAYGVVSSASCALCLCFGRLPFRVCVAASFWYGIRVSGIRLVSATWLELQRVEVLSGVPCKLFVAVESRLERRMRFIRPRMDLMEGWADSENA